MARAGVDPALEPFRATLDRARVGRLAGQDGPRRRRVVRFEEVRQPLLGGGSVRVERQRDVRRAGHGARRAPRGPRRVLHAGEVLGEELDAGAGGKPRVETRSHAQRRRPAAADPDRRAARPLRLGLHRDVLQREVLAAEAHVVAPPERLTDLDRLEESSDPVLEGNAGGGELLADRRVVGGEADPEDDAPIGHAVERADDVRQHHRVAHIVGTLDRVADGRVILGVGFAADNPSIRKEFAAAGVPFEHRVGRFLETIEICQALWRRDHVSFSGKHFTLQDVTMEPKPQRPGGPPIWIGGSGPTALRVAARFDAWFPTGPSVEFFAEHFPGVQNAARAAGRAPGAVAGAAYVTLALDSNRAAAEQRLANFLETYYSAPARTILARQATYAGPIEGCAEWLQRWIDAGARHFTLRFAGGDQLRQVDEAASKLLPRLKRG